MGWANTLHELSLGARLTFWAELSKSDRLMGWTLLGWVKITS